MPCCADLYSQAPICRLQGRWAALHVSMPPRTTRARIPTSLPAMLFDSLALGYQPSYLLPAAPPVLLFPATETAARQLGVVWQVHCRAAMARVNQGMQRDTLRLRGKPNSYWLKHRQQGRNNLSSCRDKAQTQHCHDMPRCPESQPGAPRGVAPPACGGSGCL